MLISYASPGLRCDRIIAVTKATFSIGPCRTPPSCLRYPSWLRIPGTSALPSSLRVLGCVLFFVRFPPRYTHISPCRCGSLPQSASAAMTRADCVVDDSDSFQPREDLTVMQQYLNERGMPSPLPQTGRHGHRQCPLSRQGRNVTVRDTESETGNGQPRKRIAVAVSLYGHYCD